MKKYILLFSLVHMLFLNSCSVEDFLNEKPESTMLVPTDLHDFQLLLNHPRMNYYAVGLGLISSDDIHYSKNALASLSPLVRNTYLWDKDMFAGEREIRDWDISYFAIFTANNVLEGVTELSAPQNAKNDLIGQALFKRAFAYFDLVLHFCNVYSEQNLDLPGLPLKLEADVNIIHQRATIGEVFEVIIADLKQSIQHLSQQKPNEDRSRPSIQAGHGLLSRIYLYMGDYKQAYTHADSCLMIADDLLDFHTIDTVAIISNWISNPELIYDSKSANYLEIINSPTSSASVSSDLFSSYGDNDLRKAVYFYEKSDGEWGMNQNYLGSFQYVLTGLTIGEVYLTLIEALLKTGNKQEALDKLHQFLSKRYNEPAESSKFSANEGELLNFILEERRRELAWRNIRWMDLKRFNRDGRDLTLKREDAGQLVELLPNSNRYIFSIPQSEIDQSNIEQNQR